MATVLLMSFPFLAPLLFRPSVLSLRFLSSRFSMFIGVLLLALVAHRDAWHFCQRLIAFLAAASGKHLVTFTQQAIGTRSVGCRPSLVSAACNKERKPALIARSVQ